MKQIVFITIPHFLAEIEANKTGIHARNIVIVSGSSPKSIILDYSPELSRFNLAKGHFIADLNTVQKDVEIKLVDYAQAENVSGDIISFLKQYSIIVEEYCLGQFYIDLTGTRRLFGNELDTCTKIIKKLCNTMNLNAAAGIGSNKLIAFLAANQSPVHYASRIFINMEKVFLDSLPVSALPDISSLTKKELLHTYNIKNIKDLSFLEQDELRSMFPKDWEQLLNYSRNISTDTLHEKKKRKTISQEIIVSSENNDDSTVRHLFLDSLINVCSELRSNDIFPTKFILKIIYQDDYETVFQKKIRTPTFLEKKIYAELLPYLDKALDRRICIKKIILTFHSFVLPFFQHSFFNNDEKQLRLSATFDRIRSRFGIGSITYASLK